MKLYEIQGLARQPSIIHTRLFLWQDACPDCLNESSQQNAHIPGWRMNEHGYPIFTGNFDDSVQGVLLTNLQPESIREAVEFFPDSSEMITVPVLVQTVRIEALMFI